MDQLVGGQVSAVEIETTFLQLAEKQGATTILNPLTAYPGLELRVFLMGRKSWVAENKGAVKSVQAALTEADQFVIHHNLEAQAVLEKNTGQTASVVRADPMPNGEWVEKPSLSELTNWTKIMVALGVLSPARPALRCWGQALCPARSLRPAVTLVPL